MMSNKGLPYSSGQKENRGGNHAGNSWRKYLVQNLTLNNQSIMKTNLRSEGSLARTIGTNFHIVFRLMNTSVSNVFLEIKNGETLLPQGEMKRSRVGYRSI